MGYNRPVWIGAMTVFYGSARALQSMLQTIMEIDQQMTELRRVTSTTSEGYNQFLEEAISLSNELGNNLQNILQSAIGFSRQGYSMAEAMALTRTATVASNVSDLSADEAMSDITSAMVQFNITAEKSISIVDKLNEVNILASVYRNVA